MAKKKSKKDKSPTAFNDAPEFVYGGVNYGSFVIVPDPKYFVRTDDDISYRGDATGDMVVYQKVGTAKIGTTLVVDLSPSYPTKDENQSKETTNK